MSDRIFFCKTPKWAGASKAGKPVGGFRKVTCPVLPPLSCTWPRCNCEIDLVYAPGLKNLPKRGVR